MTLTGQCRSSQLLDKYEAQKYVLQAKVREDVTQEQAVTSYIRRPSLSCAETIVTMTIMKIVHE